MLNNSPAFISSCLDVGTCTYLWAYYIVDMLPTSPFLQFPSPLSPAPPHNNNDNNNNNKNKK